MLKKVVGFSCLTLILASWIAVLVAFPQGPQGGTIGTSGSGSTSCSGAGCILATGYGVKADVQTVQDATWASGGSTVSCPNNDCNFVPADTGKACFGLIGTNTGPVAAGTFTYVSAQSGTCNNSALANGAATANGTFAWGHDDTPALTAATVALYALPNGGTLQLPSGHMFLLSGVGSVGATPGCVLNYPSGAPASGCTILGYGYISTYIVPLPGFVFTANGNNGCSARGCFWNNTTTNFNAVYENFSIDGYGQTLAGLSTAPASALFTIGQNGFDVNVNLFNWASSATNNPTPMQYTGTGAYGIGTALITFGYAGQNLFCNSALATFYEAFSSAGLVISPTASCSDFGGQYAGQTGFAPVNVNGGNWYSHNTLINNLTAANESGIAMNGGANAYLDGTIIANSGSNVASSSGVQFFSSNSTVYADDAIFNGGSTGGSVKSNSAGFGTFVDRGGNSFPVTTAPFSGSRIGSVSQSKCSNVNPVTSSGGAVTTDQNLMSCTLSPNDLNWAGSNGSGGRILNIFLAGVYSTPAASTTTVNLKVKLCSVSGCATGNVATLLSITSSALGTVQATNNPFSLIGYSTTQTSGTNMAYEAHGFLTIDIAALSTAAESVFADNNTATVTGTPAGLDGSTSLFLQVSVAFSVANASNLATQRQFRAVLEN
jgi:hypothetical protein